MLGCPALAIGSVAARSYRVMEYLETVGKFEIYRAQDSSGQRVRLKWLTNFGSDGDDLARYVREIRTCCIIDSPHVNKTIAVEQEAESLCIVTEYPSGESLRDILERQPTMPVEDAVEIAQQCLGGLEAAHRLLIIHRDLKPENVYVERIDGNIQVKIADFGMAGFRGVEPNMSVTGYFRGTPGYMPPEQVYLWPDIAVSSDIFALGVMLFEMLTGLLPYGDNWRIAPANALEENMAPHPAAPEGLWKIVKCAIHPLPSQRYRSTRAMRTAIEDFSGKKRPTMPPASRRPVAIGAAIGVLVGFALAWTSVRTAGFASKASKPTPNVTHLQTAAVSAPQRLSSAPASVTPAPRTAALAPTIAPQTPALVKVPLPVAPSKVLQSLDQGERVEPQNVASSGYSKATYSQKTMVARPAQPTITVEVSAQLADVDDLKILLDGVAQHRATWGVALPMQLGSHQLVATAPGRKAWATTVSLNAARPHQKINIPILKEQDAPEGATPLYDANLATADIP